MASSTFEFVVGVNPGYFHDNPLESPMSVVIAAWDRACEENLAEGGLYVPAVMTPGRVVYRREWGCPVNGEDVVIVRGSLNPAFVEGPPIRWGASVALICEKVRVLLNQTTATLTMTECEFDYLK